MEQTLVGLESEVQMPASDRPVLLGEPTSGNAWAEYQLAADLMKDKGPLWILSLQVDALKTRALLEQLVPALEHLRRGARCGRASRQVDWRREMIGIPIQHLGILAVVQARQWAAEGRFHDAVELMLDGVRVSADVGTGTETIGFMVSMANLWVAFEGMAELVAKGDLKADDLLLLDAGLERLDRSMPGEGVALVTGALARGWELRRAPSMGDYVTTLSRNLQMKPPEIPTWRYAFSERLVMADYVETYLDQCRRLAATVNLSWTEAAPIVRAVDHEIRNAQNPLTPVWAPLESGTGHFGILATARDRRAQVRLLRMAARWRATGQILELKDPFGDKLSHRLEDGRLRLWSVGRDGVDDGGSGAWAGYLNKDIVLEVSK
jgi:hypothetical protein